MADRVVSCATCRAFDHLRAGLDIGVCRLEPPKVYVLYAGTAKQEHVRTYWPEVRKDEWCCAWPGKELPNGE